MVVSLDSKPSVKIVSFSVNARHGGFEDATEIT